MINTHLLELEKINKNIDKEGLTDELLKDFKKLVANISSDELSYDEQLVILSGILS